MKIPSLYNLCTFICCLLCGTLLSLKAKDDPKSTVFIVTSTPSTPSQSKRALKETMGESVENVLHTCASVQASLGTMQTKLANMQTRLLQTGNNLLNNTGPLKHAKRTDLQASIDLLDTIYEELKAHQKTIASLDEKMKTTPCLAKTS